MNEKVLDYLVDKLKKDEEVIEELEERLEANKEYIVRFQNDIRCFALAIKNVNEHLQVDKFKNLKIDNYYFQACLKDETIKAFEDLINLTDSIKLWS